MKGRQVRLLLQERVQAGRQRLVWDGKASNGLDVAAGTYLIRMAADGREDAVRVTPLR